jgi:hypothetical protein
MHGFEQEIKKARSSRYRESGICIDTLPETASFPATFNKSNIDNFLASVKY